MEPINSLAIMPKEVTDSLSPGCRPDFLKRPDWSKDGFWFWPCCGKKLEEKAPHGNCKDCFNVNGYFTTAWPYQIIRDKVGKMATLREDIGFNDTNQLRKVGYCKAGKFVAEHLRITAEDVQYLSQFKGFCDYCFGPEWSLQTEDGLINRINEAAAGRELLCDDGFMYLAARGLLEPFVKETYLPMYNRHVEMCKVLHGVVQRIQAAGQCLSVGSF